MPSFCRFLLFIEVHPGTWRTGAKVWKAGTTGSSVESLRVAAVMAEFSSVCKMNIFVRRHSNMSSHNTLSAAYF